MNNLKENFIKAIIKKMKSRLGRELEPDEINVLSIQRSGIAYEIILDFISDEDKSKNELENYLKNIKKEEK